VQPGDQLSHRGFCPGKVRFDAAVRAVPRPARYTKLVGLLLGPCSKEDALHPAGYPDMSADAAHHTTLISGASSAFMPTTL